jgi:hypothetical protein
VRQAAIEHATCIDGAHNPMKDLSSALCDASTFRASLIVRTSPDRHRCSTAAVPGGQLY